MKRMRHWLLCISLLGWWSAGVFAQNPQQIIDALLIKLETADEDTNKVFIIRDIGRQYTNIDSYDEAMRYFNAALSLSVNLNFRRGESSAIGHIGDVYRLKGNIPEALKNLFAALEINKEIGNKKSLAVCYLVIGGIYNRQYKPEALDYFQEALRIFKELGENAGVADALNEIGNYYRSQDNDTEAVANYEEVVRIYEGLGERSRLGPVYVSLGNLYASQENYPEALKYFNAALNIFKELGYKSEISTISDIIAKVYLHQGDVQEALEMSLESLRMQQEIGNKYGVAYASLNIGRCYDQLQRFAEALAAYETALTLCTEIEDKASIAEIHQWIGAYYTREGNLRESLEHHWAQVRICEEMEDKTCMIRGYHNIGTCYESLGNDAKAIEIYFAALKISEEINDNLGIGQAYNNIGVVYAHQRNDSESLKYYRLSLKQAEENNDKGGIAQAHLNIGTVYSDQGHHAEALKSFSKSLKIAEEIEDVGTILHDLHNIGVSNGFLGNYSEALLNLHRALALCEKYQISEEITEACVGIGNVLIEFGKSENSPDNQKKFDEAIQYLNRGLSLAIEAGYKRLMGAAYASLSEAYKEKNDFQKALEFQTLSIALKDSLLNNETTRQLEQLRTQYEVEKAVSEEKVQQEKALAEQQFLNERTLAERNARHQLELVEETARRERAIALEKLNYEFALAEEKSEQERVLAEQKFQSEKQLAEESAKHELTLAEERSRAERERAERERRAQIVLTAGIVLAIIGLFIFLLLRQRNLKRKAIEQAETVRKMSELELQSLRAQLNPHFMFNSLNAIQELILMEENDKSHTYLARFAKLLRMLLENANSPFIPLARELEFLELYLSLENLRIPDLKYNIRIDKDINTEQTKIPNMILQPYIENAIWHGLSHKKGEKKLQISIDRQNGSTRYEIEDNGVGRQKAAEMKSLYRKEHKSKGMELLTKRFRLLSKEYGSEIKTDITDVITNQEVGGTRVSLMVPGSLQEQFSLKQMN